MTQQEFFAHTQLHPDRINIWYDGIPAGGGPFTIRAITVPALDNNIPAQDVSDFLEDLQQITVPLSTGNNLTLNIVSGNLTQSVPPGSLVTVKYFYYTVTPVVVSSIGSTATTSNGVVFAPSLDTYILGKSPYNTIQGTVEESRPSSYIMQSDRYKIGTLANPTYTGPLNINQLLSGSASKADVQDSNYTSTGWTNGRYEGSKTDRIDYKTEPAITGKFFQASEFPSGSTMGQISYLISSSQVVYKEYFYAGIGDTPGFLAQYSGYKLNYSYTSEPVIIISPEQVNTNPVVLVSGDLIRQQGRDEVMRVTYVGVAIGPSGPYYQVTVQRGYFGAIENLDAGAILDKIYQVQIYNVEGNKLAGVPRGLLLVKETGAIIKLDSLGFVISST